MPKDNTARQTTAIAHLVATLLAICAVEFLTMMTLPSLGFENRWAEAFFNVAILMIVVLGVNFFLLYRPLQKSLARSNALEEQYRDLAEVGSDWFWEMDQNFTFTFISSNYELATGGKAEDLVGQKRTDVGIMQGNEIGWRKHLADLENHRPFKNFEYQITDSAGQLIWFRTSGRPFFDKDGSFLGYRGTGTECTAEHNARDAEKRTRAMLSGIMDRSLIAYLVLEAVRNQNGAIADFRAQYLNRKAERYFRAPKDRFLGKLVKMQLPDVIDEELFQMAVRAVKRNEPFDIEKEFTFHRKRHWFRVLGVKLNDGVVVSFTDITRRKKAEHEQNLASAVFETSTEAMMITDTENKIVSVNPAFCRLTGYNRTEVIGRDPKFLGSGRHNRAFFERMWESLHTNDQWTGELWNRRKDGGIMVSRAAISVIRDKQTGKISNYVEVFGDITSQKRESEAIRHLANHDALTGLPNRILLEDRVKTAIEKSTRNKSRLAIFYLDLDRFKPINDTHGHLVGDQVLQNVAERMQVCVRSSDTVARIGGDEFILLCLDGGSNGALKALGEKIREALLKPFHVGNLELQLDASIGIAIYPENGQTFIDLVSLADDAMYQAKRGATKVIIAE